METSAGLAGRPRADRRWNGKPAAGTVDGCHRHRNSRRDRLGGARSRRRRARRAPAGSPRYDPAGTPRLVIDDLLHAGQRDAPARTEDRGGASSTWASSRTFPGQVCSRRISSTRMGSFRVRTPYFSINFPRSMCARVGMSSARSRRGGSAMRSTAMRVEEIGPEAARGHRLRQVPRGCREHAQRPAGEVARPRSGALRGPPARSAVSPAAVAEAPRPRPETASRHPRPRRARADSPPPPVNAPRR